MSDRDDGARVLGEAVAAAEARPADVDARIAAAYACDRWGTEEDACVHYDAAWRLGVPDDQRRKFMLGYGSTLRNVGRIDESLEVLTQAAADYPDYPALPCFLALSLHSAGEHRAAIATLLSAILDVAAPTRALDGYERALAYDQRELIEPGE